MLKVVNHLTGAAMAYDTLPEALAAGRHLADQLAIGQDLHLCVEQAGAGELLIGGKLQGTADDAAIVPLVWVVSEMPPRARQVAG
jgi:hypothetical protein